VSKSWLVSVTVYTTVQTSWYALDERNGSIPLVEIKPGSLLRYLHWKFPLFSYRNVLYSILCPWSQNNSQKDIGYVKHLILIKLTVIHQRHLTGKKQLSQSSIRTCTACCKYNCTYVELFLSSRNYQDYNYYYIKKTTTQDALGIVIYIQPK